MSPRTRFLPTVMSGTTLFFIPLALLAGSGIDYAKLFLDADQLTMMPKLVNGIDLSEKWA